MLTVKFQLRTTFILLLSLALLWFWIFGGEVFGPMMDRAYEKRHWRDYLEACAPEEVRVQQYLGGGEVQKGSFNLKTGQIVGEPAPAVGSYGLFLGNIKSVFHTINFPIMPPRSEEQIRRVKEALAALPPPHSSGAESYHGQFHIAFYQGAQLRIYDYPQAEAWKALKDFFNAMGFSLISPRE